jgi:hypothetical protein
MTLPYDIARCYGVPGSIMCDRCRRKEPGDPVRQVYMAPPPEFVAHYGPCEKIIERAEA